MVQWLKLCTPSAGAQVPPLARELDPTCRNSAKKQEQSRIYDQCRQHIKNRGIILQTKVYLVKTMVFSIMYGCQSWTIKKAEPRRIFAFELWCWRRLESPLGCREIKPVNPKGTLGTT